MSRKQLDRSGADFRDLDGDDAGCVIVHVDMDAFFASAELLARPELRGRAVIVGGRELRGVVVSATYEAREYGVHAAMPMAQAVRQCPQAVVIEPSRGLYRECSEKVMEVLRTITDQVAPVSVDEAYLDISGSLRRLGRPREIGALIRRRVVESTGLTCSVGLAANRLVAKLASTHSKPDGLLAVPAAQSAAFVQRLPVQALPGVGPSLQEKLSRYAISTVADLAELGEARLVGMFGSQGRVLAEQAQGRGAESVEMDRHDRSISAERTFFEPLHDDAEIDRELLRLCDRVAGRLRASGLVASGLGIKLRRPDFSTRTRSHTLPAPSDVAQEIHLALRPVLREALDGHAVRLLGVRTHGLMDAEAAGRQAALDEPTASRREAERALDAVRSRFGDGAIGAGALLGEVRRREGAQDH